MKTTPWTDALPTEPGKYLKFRNGLKYPDVVDVVADPNGVMLELNSRGKFWELRVGDSKWARILDE